MLSKYAHLSNHYNQVYIIILKLPLIPIHVFFFWILINIYENINSKLE